MLRLGLSALAAVVVAGGCGDAVPGTAVQGSVLVPERHARFPAAC